jgi:hypothetical protein
MLAAAGIASTPAHKTVSFAVSAATPAPDYTGGGEPDYTGGGEPDAVIRPGSE